MQFARLVAAIVDLGVPTHEHHPLRVRRLRLVSLGTWLLMAVSVPFVFTCWSDSTALALALVAMLAVGIGNLALLRISGSVAVCGNVATGMLCFMLSVISVGLGGLYDAGFGWLYVVPLAGFVMVGLRSGLCWTALTLGATLLLWLLPESGPPVAALPAASYGTQALVGRLAAIGAIAALAMALIGSQRLAERTLERASDSAQAASRAKSDFLAAMSHEIRTPMTSILGYAEILAEEHEVSPEQRCALSIIRRNGEHLMQIVNDVLDLSKIEANRLDIEIVRFSPVDVVAEVEGQMWVRADAAGLELKVEYEGEQPSSILGDPLRLQQVLINLVSNAIKFTEQGTVTIAMRTIYTETGTNLEVEVIDTGIGLSESERDQLFSAFAQAQVDTARRFGGTGLGLAICARLCELMRGAIDLRSEKGKGSIFRLTLFDVQAEGVVRDLAEEPAWSRDLQRSRSSEERSYQGRRFLLAEDSLDNQRLIDHVLRGAGADVTIAENGRVAVDQALAAFEAGRPFDAILMDMQMPELDGYQATRELRQAGYSHPILALTAHAMSHLRARCFEAGCDDFATKPLDRAKLFAALDRQLANAKP